MKERDLNDIAAVEKAISSKYGNEAIANTRSGWDQEKEKEYIEQVKVSEEKRRELSESRDKKELDG